MKRSICLALCLSLSVLASCGANAPNTCPDQIVWNVPYSLCGQSCAKSETAWAGVNKNICTMMEARISHAPVVSGPYLFQLSMSSAYGALSLTTAQEVSDLFHIFYPLTQPTHQPGEVAGDLVSNEQPYLVLINGGNVKEIIQLRALDVPWMNKGRDFIPTDRDALLLEIMSKMHVNNDGAYTLIPVNINCPISECYTIDLAPETVEGFFHMGKTPRRIWTVQYQQKELTGIIEMVFLDNNSCRKPETPEPLAPVFDL
ncbi:MAG TPA: hypothetical protein VMX18_03525 [Candidatus Bipolaricaulota bacterium]|nr:hypothetical protein [Candidatus Bipolaricaulota bacterium]